MDVAHSFVPDMNFHNSVVCSLLCQTAPHKSLLVVCNPSNTIIIAKVIAIFITLLQLVAVTSICILHFLLFRTRKESQNVLGKSKFTKDSNVSLLVQLIFLSVSNFICWIPTNIIFLISTFASRYPFQMVTWTVIAVVPISTPTVFIFS